MWRPPIHSELAEWLIAPPWKGDYPKGYESSNLSLTAKIPPAPSVIGVARLAHRPGAVNREGRDRNTSDLSNRCADLQQGRSKSVVTGKSTQVGAILEKRSLQMEG